MDSKIRPIHRNSCPPFLCTYVSASVRATITAKNCSGDSVPKERNKD
ncbi:hypothetical protein TSMEX_001341 [Taenia solium]|eukprot:TsM_000262800 transcript=TsM_000262800 gene=TsM_000262800